jgi:hypothetical protein
MIETKAFRTFIAIYSLFSSELARASIKLSLHKALIKSVMIYASPPGNKRREHTEYTSQNFSASKTRFSSSLEIFHDTQRSTICTRIFNLPHV